MSPLKELTADVTDSGSITSGLKLGLGRKRLIKLKHRHPGNAVSLDLSAPGWGVNYDLKSKDLLLEHSRSTKLGSLSIKQRIPNQKFFLVPSPEVKLVVRPKALNKARTKNETSLSHDFQKAVSKIEHSLTLRNKYTATLTADTASGPKGASLVLSAKLGARRLTSVGLTVSKSGGPVVKAEAQLPGGKRSVRVKSEYRAKSKEVKLEVSPPAINKKLALTLTSTIKATQPLKRPSLLIGARLEV